jgi:hypothetical protein
MILFTKQFIDKIFILSILSIISKQQSQSNELIFYLWKNFRKRLRVSLHVLQNYPHI